MPQPVESQIKSGVICLCQLLRNVLVEDFLHGQGHDAFVAALEKRFDLWQNYSLAADVA